MPRDIEERANAGAVAIECHAEHIDGGIGVATEELAVDLVTNVLHWCQSQGIDSEAVLRMASSNFFAEREGIE